MVVVLCCALCVVACCWLVFVAYCLLFMVYEYRCLLLLCVVCCVLFGVGLLFDGRFCSFLFAPSYRLLLSVVV